MISKAVLGLVFVFALTSLRALAECDNSAAPLDYATIKQKVAANNRTITFSDQAVVALIYMESTFHPSNCAAPPNTARGLTSVTKGALQDVAASNPAFGSFTIDDLLDPDKNIQVGTTYLEMRSVIHNSDGSLTHLSEADALKRYGTGNDTYATKIIKGEACLKALGPSDPVRPCLDLIRQP